jgi:hypothetical protein
MDKRKHKRLTTRLHVKLSSPSIICWGILCDASQNGLFIKSNQDVAVGEIIDIEIFMPDKTSCLLSGTVRRRSEFPDSYRKHGLGVHLIGKDTAYERFLNLLNGQTKTPIHTPSTVSHKEG